MSLNLLAIVFDHEQGAASDALSIRANASFLVAKPEWQAGLTVNAEDSVAAYSIGDTLGRRIAIQVRIASSDRRLISAEVRAVSPRPGCTSVLGEVSPQRLNFGPSGDSGFQLFELKNHSLWTRGVGVDYLTWRWQFRGSPGLPWTTFAETQHKIYTVLSAPTAPWTQAPVEGANVQLPWTEVMDYACRWARGTHTPDAAAVAITRAVYNLGPEIIEYACEAQAGSHYTTFPFQYFECTKFLERLRGGRGWGQFVNCTDCATIVSTFANILGCDLWQSRMAPNLAGGFLFAMNAVLTIGSSVWQTACTWPGFSFHEVAWKGACTADNEVFDACLQVDGDADPSSPPHVPLQPVNMRFGRPGDGLYRDRLAGPNGTFDCEPQPLSRIRRFVR